MRHLSGLITTSVALALLATACSSASPEAPSTSQPQAATTTPTEVPTPITTTSTSKPQTNTPVSAYFIGNSLTWDTLGSKPNEFVSLNVLARQAEYKFTPMGYHILCGSSLVNITDNPNETCVDPEPDIGTLADAFPSSDWDVVSLQPYPGEGSTMSTDETMITGVMASAGAATEFFMLTGWPRISEFDAVWPSDVVDDDDTATIHARQYFDLLAQRLSARRPITIIPVGDVLFELGKRIDAGDIPGLTDLSQLYRDDIHLTQQGQWAAGVTAASVILDAGPYEFGKPRAPWYGDSTGFSKEYIAVVREVVAMVLANR